MRKKAVSGFSLIEVSFALVIAGLLFSGLLLLMKSVRQARQQALTATHQERIFYALGQFAGKKGHLPCPADPEKRDGIARSFCLRPDLLHGDVPFRTLGLAPQVSKNGRGLYFRYVLNPELSLKSTVQVKGSHAYCKLRASSVVRLEGRSPAEEELSIAVAIISLSFPGSGLGTWGVLKKDDVLWLRPPSASNPVKLRYETQENLGSYYGKIFCEE